MPPQAVEVQLGKTLKFIIDHLAITDGETPDAVLELLTTRAKSLPANIETYAEVVRFVASINQLRGETD